MAANLRPVRDALRRFPNIRQAIAFGSMARGTARADSDLDIAIEADRRLSVADVMELTEAQLIRRHVFESEDFLPHVERMLTERRRMWTG